MNIQQLTLEFQFPKKEMEESYSNHLDLITIFNAEKRIAQARPVPLRSLPDGLIIELWYVHGDQRRKFLVQSREEKRLLVIPSASLTITPTIRVVVAFGREEYNITAIVRGRKVVDNPNTKLVSYLKELASENEEHLTASFALEYKDQHPSLIKLS